MSGYLGPNSGSGQDNELSLSHDGIWYTRRPVWRSTAASGSRLLGGAGVVGVPWNAAGGGWFSVVFFPDATAGLASTICQFNNAGASLGWRLSISVANLIQIRVRDGGGAERIANLGTAINGVFNAAIFWVDLAVVAGSLNNAAEVSAASVGFSPAPAQRQVLCGRDDAASGGYTDGGVHAAVGNTGAVPTVAERAAFWPAAKQFGIGRYGQGVGATGQSKWVAHTLADRIGANTLTNTTAVASEFRDVKFAW